ncbi:MAG: sigma-54-dependent Fis family transcriptional regulator [Deltaproteobacteria bacterium]|nr:MAG: sigma-54-dependent Fis family transcriptional regulator [Deltaproteobacteria bacterium]
MKEKGRVYVFDDDADSLESVAAALRRDGFEVLPFADPREGLARLAADGGDVVVTDLRMPGLTGLEVLRHVSKSHPGVPVVVLTAYGTVEGAVEAVRSGASDFLLKPVEIPRLRAAVFKAVKERGMHREIQRLRQEVGRPEGIEGIVGASRAMEEVVRRIRLVAPTRMNVLVTGESGTGKELVARAVHALSPRNGRPFLPLNCAAIPETLLESELFGYEKGSFTGATASRAGKLESAEGGTLFLDEVGDVSPAIQAKLLRAIEQKEVMRVGGSQVIRVDVRIIAATNQDLKGKVEEKTFREDLYYRLNVFNIVVPALRERREDIPKLCEHLLEVLEREDGAPPKRLSPSALKALLGYRWPGNVRQLRNALETATLVSQGETIEPGDLPPEVTQAVLPPTSAEPIPLPASRTLTELTRDAIRDALAKTGGNKTHAAKLLGIGLRTLHRKVKEFELP